MTTRALIIKNVDFSILDGRGMIEADKNIVVAGLYAKRVVDTAIEMSISVARLAEHTGIDEKTYWYYQIRFPGHPISH